MLNSKGYSKASILVTASKKYLTNNLILFKYFN